MTCHTPAMRLTLYFNRMVYQTTGTSVTSLRVKEGSEDIVTLECVEDGQPATTGNLQIGVDFNASVDPVADSLLTTAFKEFEENEFKAGPVVVGVKAGSANVLLSGGVAGAEDTAMENYRYGQVTITVLEDLLGGELNVELVKLDGVTEEAFEDVLGLGFPPDRTTSFRGRVRIPAGLDVTSLTLVWRGWIFGQTAGTIPPLEMTYRRLPRPGVPTTPIDLTVDETDHVLDTSTLADYAAEQYAELASDEIPVVPGDVLLFTITRPAAEGDGYDDEIQVINQYIAITGAS